MLLLFPDFRWFGTVAFTDISLSLIRFRLSDETESSLGAGPITFFSFLFFQLFLKWIPPPSFKRSADWSTASDARLQRRSLPARSFSLIFFYSPSFGKENPSFFSFVTCTRCSDSHTWPARRESRKGRTSLPSRAVWGTSALGSPRAKKKYKVCFAYYSFIEKHTHKETLFPFVRVGKSTRSSADFGFGQWRRIMTGPHNPQKKKRLKKMNDGLENDRNIKDTYDFPISLRLNNFRR